jgi:hypothetical protein
MTRSLTNVGQVANPTFRTLKPADGLTTRLTLNTYTAPRLNEARTLLSKCA